MKSEAPDTIPEQCSNCSKVVAMQVKGQWAAFDRENGLPELWTAVKCPDCESSALYLQENYGNGWDEFYRVYPAQARRLSTAVPEPLRNDHREARECVQAKHYTAAAVMARRVLEGIAVDRGYKSGDLFSRLKKMRDDGVIDDRLYDWADICRDVGNQGAHADKQAVTRQDAEETLDFVEALLDYLYVFTSRYEEFKNRRANTA